MTPFSQVDIYQRFVGAWYPILQGGSSVLKMGVAGTSETYPGDGDSRLLRNVGDYQTTRLRIDSLKPQGSVCTTCPNILKPHCATEYMFVFRMVLTINGIYFN
jgi:hypothetical protein